MRCAALLAGGRIWDGGTVYELALGGCGVESEKRVNTGDRLALHVVLSPEEPPLVIDQAAVRWAHKGRLGVEFLVLSEAMQERLRRFLDRESEK